MPTLVSFDVFDTVLTRLIGAPASLFLLLGRRALTRSIIHCSPEVFFQARLDGERRARRNSTRAEVTLGGIYEEVSWGLGLSRLATEHLIQLELDLERELSRPVPHARDKIAEQRKAGSKVAFLSDMYLPTELIAELLHRAELAKEGEPVLVSAEQQKSKGSGTLFDELLRMEGISPRELTHCGNHQRTDIEVPRARGIRVVPFLEGNLNRFEQLLEGHTLATEGLASVMAGASRLARLTMVADDLEQAALRDVAAGVVAPILCSYVLWVLRQAQRLELERLYFVSRDGEILLEIARHLAPRLGISCELRYLHGGRQAWHLPALTEPIQPDRQPWLFHAADFLSVRSQLARVALEPDAITAELQAHGLPESSWTRNLQPNERERLHTLIQTPSVRERMLSVAATCRQLMIKYLVQEKVVGTQRWGMVDVGWQGWVQNSLETVVKAAGGTPPAGFYLALFCQPPDPPARTRHCFLFDHPRGLGHTQPAAALTTPIEVFCSARHGLVLGYEECPSEVRPILKDESLPWLTSGNLALIQSTIRSFLDHLHLDAELVNIEADTRSLVMELLTAFWQAPTRTEALAWGGFEFETDQSGAYRRPLAEPYRLSQIGSVLRSGEVPSHHTTSWVAGSLALTPRLIRGLLAAAVVAHKVVRKALKTAGKSER